MRQFSLFKCFIIFMSVVLCPRLVADGLKQATQFDTAGAVGQPFFSCFNTQTNQFLVTWQGANIMSSLFDPNGNQLTGPNPVFVKNDRALNIYTSPSVCYNSINNQFFVTFLSGAGGITHELFNIMDQNGTNLVGPMALTNPAGLMANSFPFCCYNSITNQYVVTWASTDSPGATQIGQAYFTIIDAAGNEQSMVLIPGSSVDTVNGSNVFVSYNATTNQYLFTWQEPDNTPYFAIYNADGTSYVARTLIPSARGLTSLVVSSCYNSVTNQYLITWIDANNGYFAIYDAQGHAVVAATQFATAVSGSSVSGVPFSSYNPQNNAYFITWSKNDQTAQFAVYSASGSVIVGATGIPNVGGATVNSFVSNSYGSGGNDFLITWVGNDGNGYDALYKVTPLPLQEVAGKRLFNRFANYGEYFNKLTWSPSSAPELAGYNIYSEGKLLATTSALQPLYEDHNQSTASRTYSISSVGTYALESTPVTITV